MVSLAKVHLENSSPVMLTISHFLNSLKQINKKKKIRKNKNFGSLIYLFLTGHICYALVTYLCKLRDNRMDWTNLSVEKSSIKRSDKQKFKSFTC